MKLHIFYRMLRAHDWHYARSDDPQAFARGQKRQAELETLAHDLGKEYEDLFAAFSKHHHGGGDRPEYRGYRLVAENWDHWFAYHGDDVEPTLVGSNIDWCMDTIDLITNQVDLSPDIDLTESNVIPLKRS